MSLETLLALMSWAALLSGYDKPENIEVQFVPHEFFVERVCGGKECNVLGAFLDAESPNVIYIDDRYTNDDSPFIRSLIVHEATHAAQWHSGEFDSMNCEQSLQREQEAYFVQNEYLVRNGNFPVIKTGQGVCRK